LFFDFMARLYENLRQLITVIDELRDVGLQNYISLPRIAAIGTQSSGKSSAIETIVGLDFLPRGGGVVTRRPLELRLVHLNSLEYTEETAWAVFDQKPDEKIKDFEKVRAIIARMTDEVAGANKGIVNEPIVMTIYGTSCPDLTVIDLPGITRVPIKGSDQSEDIEKVTRDMTLRYVSDPRTIILAVLPANQDMSTSDALQIARQVDPKGQRTIGVVTKIDIMDQGSDAVKMLRGEDIPLRLGYVGVKMRSQAMIDAKQPIKDSFADEKEWFANHRIYGKLPPGMVGTVVLIEKLTHVLLKQIRRFLPDIKREISDKRQKVEARMDELGHGVPLEDAERRQLMWTMITDYSEMFKNTIRGSYDRKLQRYLTSGSSGVEGGGSRIRSIMNDFLAEYMEHSITSDMQDSDIERAVRMHEGDSLPGFPSPDTFEFLALPHLSKIISPSVECVNAVSGALDHMAARISQVVLRRFPALANVALEMTTNIIQRERDATRHIVEQQVQCHTGYLFTNDNEYLSSHGSMENMVEGPGRQEKAQQPEEPPVPGAFEKAGHQIKEGARGGYDKMSSMVKGPTKKEARYSGTFVSEIRHRLDSYFDVMIRNVRDLIPKAIGFYLVRAVVDKIQFELLNSLNDDARITELLGEPPHIMEERKMLNTQKQTLMKAHGVMTRDPTLASIAFEAEIEEEEGTTGTGSFTPGARGSMGGDSSAAKQASGAGMFAKATGAASNAAAATAAAASSASSAIRQQASSTGNAMQQQATSAATNAMMSAASNPAVQKQAAQAVAQAAQNPQIRQGVAAAATQNLFGNKPNPLGGGKKGLFEDS